MDRGARGEFLKCSYEALVIHGAADTPSGLLIEDGRVSFFEAEDVWVKTVGRATDELEERFGPGSSMSVIGQGLSEPGALR